MYTIIDFLNHLYKTIEIQKGNYSIDEKSARLITRNHPPCHSPNNKINTILSANWQQY